MSEINLLDRPQLNNPVLIMGFSGWANAGEVSTETVNYLASRLNAQPLANVEPDHFYDYATERPTALIQSGLVREFKYPEPVFSYAKGRDEDSDLIFFTGPEPQRYWERFTDLVLNLAEEFSVRAIFILGGLYDYSPHWVDPRVSVIYSGYDAAGYLANTPEVVPGEYQGPVSIHTLILTRARDRDLPVVNLWGHAPTYIQTGNLKVQRCLTEILKKAIGFSLDTSDLLDGIAEMDRQIEDLVANNPRLKKYLDEMRDQYEEAVDTTTTVHKRPHLNKSGEKGKVISMDSFLRREED